MGDRLDRDATERVIRRAVELSEETTQTEQSGIEVDALLAAAVDIGVEPISVYRAVAEEQAGLLDDDGSRSLVDRITGPVSVSTARVIDSSVEGTLELVDVWLRRVWSFRRVRLLGNVAEYRRRTDPAAGIQRSARALTGKENADKVRSLRIVVHGLDDERTLVAMVADLQASRTYAEVGGATVAASGTLLSTAAAFSADNALPGLWALLGMSLSTATGFALMSIRRAWTRGIDTVLEGVLDRIVEQQRPDTVLDSITDRLRRPRQATGRTETRARERSPSSTNSTKRTRPSA